MNNLNQTKLVWQTPEIINLDIENTLSGSAYHPTEIDTTAGPS